VEITRVCTADMGKIPTPHVDLVVTFKDDNGRTDEAKAVVLGIS